MVAAQHPLQDLRAPAAWILVPVQLEEVQDSVRPRTGPWWRSTTGSSVHWSQHYPHRLQRLGGGGAGRHGRRAPDPAAPPLGHGQRRAVPHHPRGSVRRSHSRGDDRLLLLARTTTTKEDFWNLIAKDGSLHEIRKLYKIGPRHLNCRQRVKLAVLILSMSVSNAFQLKEETKAEIIRTIDEV